MILDGCWMASVVIRENNDGVIRKDDDLGEHGSNDFLEMKSPQKCIGCLLRNVGCSENIAPCLPLHSLAWASF